MLFLNLYAFLEFSRVLRKHFSTLTITYGDAYLLESKNVRPIFSFYFNFCITFQLVKKRGKMKEDCFKYTLPKKIRKANKTKKLNAKVRETRQY